MAFFFSVIRAQAPPKGKGKKRASAPEPQSYDSNDEVVTPSPVASNTSPVQLSNHSTVVDEKLHPTTNYWIALTKPHGTPANPIFIHHALLLIMTRKLWQIMYITFIALLFIRNERRPWLVSK